MGGGKELYAYFKGQTVEISHEKIRTRLQKKKLNRET